MSIKPVDVCKNTCEFTHKMITKHLMKDTLDMITDGHVSCVICCNLTVGDVCGKCEVMYDMDKTTIGECRSCLDYNILFHNDEYNINFCPHCTRETHREEIEFDKKEYSLRYQILSSL